MSYSAKHASKQYIFLSDVTLASKTKGRMIGLLKHKELKTGEGMWIKPCTSIHTFFMRFSIDVAFLSADGKILKTYAHLKPFRLSTWVPHAASVLEMPAGTLASQGLHVGERIIFEENQA